MATPERVTQRLGFLAGVLVRAALPPFNSFERLEEYCKRKLSQRPNAVTPRLFLADMYMKRKMFEKALPEYRVLEESGVLLDSECKSLVEALFYLEDYKEVAERLRRQPPNYLDDADMVWYLGFSLMKNGEYEKSVEYLTRSIRLGNKRYEAWWSLGICHSNLGDLARAKDAYERALAVKGSSEEVRRGLAAIHLGLGRQALMRIEAKDELLTEEGQESVRIVEEEMRAVLKYDPEDKEAAELISSVGKIRERDMQNRQKRTSQVEKR